MRNAYEHILFPGIVNVVGGHDTGKTTFALECGAPPEKICFIDDDVKGSSVAEVLEKSGHPLGMYVDLISETDGMLENQFHKYVVDLIKSIDRGQFEVIIFDNFSRFENSFQPWVLTHQKDFRTKWSPNGAIHGAEIWKSSFVYESVILNMMQNKSPLIILTSHMKKENVGGRRTGKMIPDVKPPVVKNSLFRVLLRYSDDGSPLPTAIVLKRISKKTVGESGGIETVNILPLKIKDFTWKKVRWFYENPIGNRPPKPDEVLTQHEMSMIDSSIITEDQKQMMDFIIKASEESDREESEGLDRMKAQMKSLKEEGKTITEIAEEFDTDVRSVIDILKD